MEYTQFILDASKSEEETFGTGDFIEQTDFGIGWNHDWGNRVTSSASFHRSEQSYIGSLQEDDIDSVQLGAYYAWKEWMTLGVSYRKTDKASTLNNLIYDNDGLAITIDLAL